MARRWPSAPASSRRPAEVYQDGWSPRSLRYALLAAHYRAPLEFSDESLAAAASAVERLSTVLAALDAYRMEHADDPDAATALERARAAFEASMDDDLDIAPALGAVFDLVRELNRRIDDRTLSTADAQRAAAALRDLDRVLGVMESDEAAEGDGPSAEVAALLDERVAGTRGKGLDALRHAAGSSSRDWASWSRTPETGSYGNGWSRPMARPDDPQQPGGPRPDGGREPDRTPRDHNRPRDHKAPGPGPRGPRPGGYRATGPGPSSGGDGPSAPAALRAVRLVAAVRL